MGRRKSIIDSTDLEAVNRAIAPPEENTVGFESGDIQVVQPDRMETKAREAKFMNEYIEIEIESGTEANDPMYVELGHNGINQFVKRGCVQRVRRKFLYSALMAKRVNMNCVFGKDGSGNEFNRLTPQVSTSYRARLVTDPNTQRGGSKWVQSVMAESAGARV
jgi:hypothetical protein